MPKPIQRRLPAALLLPVLLAACSPVDLLNATVSKEGYSISDGLAYGDGPRHRLDVYVPDDLAGPAPVVVFFYGGSWKNGDRSDYLFAAQALVSRGFVAVVPDYRLYPDAAFPEFLDDGALAVRWVRDSIAAHGGDPNRIFLMGHSAGAYNAAMLALDPGYLAGAGLDRGIVRGMIGLAGPYDFLPLDTRTTRQVFGAVPDLPATQPVSFADAGAPPLLLLAGADDTTVRPRNSESLARAVTEEGGTAHLRVYPDLGHIGIVLALAEGQRDRAPVLDDLEAFVAAR